MPRNPQRMVGVFALLLGVWVVTYWLYEPAEPPITYGTSPGSELNVAPLAAIESIRLEPPPDASRNSAAVSPPQPLTGVEPPKFRNYTVQAGDTSWEAISHRVYGDRRYAEAIARANPLRSPDRLKVGITVLRVPQDPTNVQGRVVTILPPPLVGKDGSASAGADPMVPPAATKPAAEDRTYTVEAGETLSEIAKKVYGKSAMWPKIAEANKDRVPDPAKLRAGITLRIPPG